MKNIREKYSLTAHQSNEVLEYLCKEIENNLANTNLAGRVKEACHFKFTSN